MHVAKTRVLISCALVCTFVCTFQFSHDMAQPCLFINWCIYTLIRYTFGAFTFNIVSKMYLCNDKNSVEVDISYLAPASTEKSTI